jgi:hypothetical protein
MIERKGTLERQKVTRETFIKKGMKQNEVERMRLGIPVELQIDPEEAWHALYGSRKWVYLEVDRSWESYGGPALIVDDDVGNGFYNPEETAN